MSILLDALKKSEEQRQLGKAPSIHSPVAEPGDGRPGSPQWIPLALMAVSAIALAECSASYIMLAIFNSRRKGATSKKLLQRK